MTLGRITRRIQSLPCKESPDSLNRGEALAASLAELELNSLPALSFEAGLGPAVELAVMWSIARDLFDCHRPGHKGFIENHRYLLHSWSKHYQQMQRLPTSIEFSLNSD